MPQYIFEISKACGVRFLPATASPGTGFHENWYSNLVPSFMKRVCYKQKWQKDDQIPIQILSSIGPVKVKVYTWAWELVKTFDLIDVTPGSGMTYTNYEGIIDLTVSEIPEGVYFFVAEASTIDLTFRMISEPQDIRVKQKNTSLFRYKNSLNDFGVTFTTGIELMFRCEAMVLDPEFDRERVAFRNQVMNVSTQSATPFEKYKLFIGDAQGVAPWVQMILNYIVSCDYFTINGERFETPEGSKWDIQRAKNYALIGCSIDLVPAYLKSSLQLSSEAVPVNGIVATYDIETEAFGTLSNPASTNPIRITTIEGI